MSTPAARPAAADDEPSNAAKAAASSIERNIKRLLDVCRKHVRDELERDIKRGHASPHLRMERFDPDDWIPLETVEAAGRLAVPHLLSLLQLRVPSDAEVSRFQDGLQVDLTGGASPRQRIAAKLSTVVTAYQKQMTSWLLDLAMRRMIALGERGADGLLVMRRYWEKLNAEADPKKRQHHVWGLVVRWFGCIGPRGHVMFPELHALLREGLKKRGAAYGQRHLLHAIGSMGSDQLTLASLEIFTVYAKADEDSDREAYRALWAMKASVGPVFVRGLAARKTKARKAARGAAGRFTARLLYPRKLSLSEEHAWMLEVLPVLMPYGFDTVRAAVMDTSRSHTDRMLLLPVLAAHKSKRTKAISVWIKVLKDDPRREVRLAAIQQLVAHAERARRALPILAPLRTSLDDDLAAAAQAAYPVIEAAAAKK